MGSKRTFFQQQDHLRVDGERRPKSRSWHSVLSARATLLGVVEVNMLQPLRIQLTTAPGRHTLHRPPEATQGWDGQKASFCEQAVDVTRAGDGAPLASTSCRKTALEPGRPSQRPLFCLGLCSPLPLIGLAPKLSYFCRDPRIPLEPGTRSELKGSDSKA